MVDWKLERDEDFAGVAGPVVVCIMDGVGLGDRGEGDAVFRAHTPVLDRLAAAPLVTQLAAHGRAVGMPSDGDMGNSEVGHNALGAGRTFEQGAVLVDRALREGTLFEGEVWRELMARCGNNKTPLHLLGLLSDGNVHSHIEHLIALLRRAASEGLSRVRVHVLLDGRDVAETSALEYLEQLEAVLAELSSSDGRDYRIASGGGRMTTTMDRYQADWSMVERGYCTHVRGQGRGFASAREAVETFRSEQPGIIDQDLPPFVVVDADGAPVGPIEDGAGVICFNFRGDRAIEISQAFDDEDFGHFERGPRPDVLYAGMMEYDADARIPLRYLVTPPRIDRTLGEYLCRNRIGQLAISETQKFGHVTYFWNGNRSGYFDDKLETYIEIPSDRLPFEQRPWMKAAEISDGLIAELRAGRARHARLNFANGDMVGHTGKLDAAILAVQTVDLCLARILPVIDELGGAIIVTADHGNADQMFELASDGSIRRDARERPRAKTSHTLNPVPCYFHGAGLGRLSLDPTVQQPSLSNVAATVLQLLGYRAPADFEPSLLRFGG
ncbi:MAG: 2,3-bisphosphoglycerate-independent phosphoglycerate mutase [Myxococcales bacterium]|nr:2,3-bisphosphoglycerate-independent phosphoglycerate mutase [Myxococcales bacterium]